MNSSSRRRRANACFGRSAALERGCDKRSSQAHENARELIWLVDHDVVPAIDDQGIPRIVTSNPFECLGEPRKSLCVDIRLSGDPLVSARELDLLGEAGGRLRRHLAVDPGSISLIDNKLRGRNWCGKRARIGL